MSDARLAEGELLDLVGEFYDCALQPANWPTALSKVASLLDGTDVVISLHHIPARPEMSLVARWNVDPAFEKAMTQHYPQNPFVPFVWYKAIDEPMSVLTEMTEAEVKATKWYSNTMGAFGYRDSAFTLLAKSTSEFGSLSIQRKAHQEPFDRDDLDLFGKLAPHVRRAVMIGDLLQTKSLERNALSAALDALSVGVILTSDDVRIVYANRRAEELLSAATALRSDAGRLTTLDSTSANALRSAVAAAASGTSVDIPKSGIVVSISRREERPLAAWVLPLDGGLRQELGATFDARVAIFIRDVGEAAQVPAEIFVRQYGVTPAECRVLLLLVQGFTPDAAAEALGVSIATVKTQIARLMQKTGVQRQVDLVRLAMSALAPTA